LDAGIPVDLDHPKVSVVMATHNDSCYLPAAINSLLKQTFQDFEVIIVNDASTDETAGLLAKLEDPRIKVITNPQNLGLTKSSMSLWNTPGSIYCPDGRGRYFLAPPI